MLCDEFLCNVLYCFEMYYDVKFCDVLSKIDILFQLFHSQKSTAIMLPFCDQAAGAYGQQNQKPGE